MCAQELTPASLAGLPNRLLEKRPKATMGERPWRSPHGSGPTGDA